MAGLGGEQHGGCQAGHQHCWEGKTSSGFILLRQRCAAVHVDTAMVHRS